jgi:biotin carboxyl carrier protein
LKLQIVIDGKAYEVEIEDSEGNLSALASGYVSPPSRTTIQSTVLTTVPRPGSISDTEDGSQVCRSPVAGIVARVVARPGEVLQADDLVIVLEAMKMETNVRALVKGRLRSIKVSSGDAVKVNQVLADFE